jgi:tetratricopeptide (TPR) repeat protein
MTTVKAFVGHSFTPGEDDFFTPTDEEVVRAFLTFFDEISHLNSNFSWLHAERAESTGIDEKVLSLFLGVNLFIGICTKKETVTPPLRKRYFLGNWGKTQPIWKTSDWIIQEIGLAIGRQCKVILLVERGLRRPGGLQGVLEYIEFDRQSPSKSFPKIMQMISSLTKEGSSATEMVVSDKSSQPTEGYVELFDDHSRIPKPDWDRKKYESEFSFALMDDEEDTAKMISDAFLSSAISTSEDQSISWKAFTESKKIIFGKGGDIKKLRELSESYPSIPEIKRYLGDGLKEFGEHIAAMNCYNKAAELTNDPSIKCRYMKLSLIQELESGKKLSDLSEGLNLMRLTGAEEQVFLGALNEIADHVKDHYLKIALLQRLLEIDPSDIELRFSLAYTYSEVNENELALLHYCKINSATREASTWNNLGVSLERENLVTEAVYAYQESIKAGNTLAMSNLALRLLNAGFLQEARDLCKKALATSDPHKNVYATMKKIDEAPEVEIKRKEDIIQKAKPISDFFAEFGTAIYRMDIDNLAAKWKFEDCVLDLTIKDGQFKAIGEYEIPKNQALGLLLGQNPNSTDGGTQVRKIEISGTIIGYSIKAILTRDTAYSRQKKPRSLLSDLLAGSPIYLILAADKLSMKALERSVDTESKFYSLKAISPPS